MNYLPIRQLSEDDLELVGKEAGFLAILARSDFPVPEGIVVFPPVFKLKTTLEYFNLKTKEIFEQRLSVLKGEVGKIPIPDDLKTYLNSKKIDPQNTWSSLLEVWLNEIRRRFWAGGFDPDLTKNLLAHPVFFTPKIIASGKVCLRSKGEVQIQISQGELAPKQREFIDGLIERINKKFLLPYVYHWVAVNKLDSGIKIVKIQEFTSDEEPAGEGKSVGPDLTRAVGKALVKPATKVFQVLGKAFSIEPGIQGMLIDACDTLDFDHQVTQLVEASHALPNCPVIFKLSDKKDSFGGLRGSLRLIHDNNLLKVEAGAFLFARHKKQLLNLELAIPFTRSVNEFLQLKRELAALGVARKATLKFWLEAAAVQNIIDLEHFLDGGLDGIILNIDELASWIGGFDLKLPESKFYTPDFAGPSLIKSVIKFVEPALKALHKLGIPLLCQGTLSLNSDLLEALIEKGVQGIIVPRQAVSGTLEHLHFLEKRLARKRMG